MATDLAIAQTSSVALPIPRASPAADTLLRWARSGAYRTRGQARLQLVNVLTAAEREILKRRWIELRDHLRNLNKQIVVAALIELFGCYRNVLKAGEDAREVAMKYLRELDGLPTWAIVRACEQIRGGGYDEHKSWPPSTIALRGIVRSYCDLPQQEMHQIAEVLQGEAAPEAVSDAEKDRVHGLLRGLADDLRTANSNNSARRIVERDARPLKPWNGEVSPQLAALIRGKVEPNAEASP